MGIKVIICKVGEKPEVTEIDKGLKAMQAVVGGMIECVQLDGDYTGGVDLWCNEEGLFCCEPNRLIGRTPINGDFFLARHNGEGTTISLTKADVAKWLPKMRAAPVAITSL
jgi:hypothetical protein